MGDEDILRMLGEVIERNIKEQLLKPHQSRTYAGKPKSPNAISDSVSSGRLLNSVTVKWDNTDGNIRMVVEFPGAPEWQVVNSGRRGKQQSPTLKYPPLSAIANWTREKPIGQFRDRRGRFISNAQRNFLIQRSIGEYGFQGTYFLDKAIQKSLNDIEVNFGIYGRTYIEEIIQRKLILRTGKIE